MIKDFKLAELRASARRLGLSNQHAAEDYIGAHGDRLSSAHGPEAARVGKDHISLFEGPKNIWRRGAYEPASIFAVWGVFILLLVSPLSFSTFRVFVLCPMNPLQGSRASKRSHCGAVRPSARISHTTTPSLRRRANLDSAR